MQNIITLLVLYTIVSKGVFSLFPSPLDQG